MVLDRSFYYSMSIPVLNTHAIPGTRAMDMNSLVSWFFQKTSSSMYIPIATINDVIGFAGNKQATHENFPN